MQIDPEAKIRFQHKEITIIAEKDAWPVGTLTVNDETRGILEAIVRGRVVLDVLYIPKKARGTLSAGIFVEDLEVLAVQLVEK